MDGESTNRCVTSKAAQVISNAEPFVIATPTMARQT